MNRDLKQYEARKLAKIVGLAVWARMANATLDEAERVWRNQITLLDDAFDAALKAAPEELVRPQRDGTGSPAFPTANTINKPLAWVGAFNALDRMPRCED